MKIAQQLSWTIISSALSFTMAITTAEAATFKFSYLFESGETLSGQVDGDLEEILPGVTRLNNISNFSAEYSGEGGINYSFPIPGFDLFSLSGTTRLVFRGADIPSSLIGDTGNGFEFFAGTGAPGPFGRVIIGEYTPNVNGSSFRSTGEQEIFEPKRWQAFQVTQTTPVSEPSSMISLVILGIIGYRIKRYRA
jgi:hypothetical protein